MIPLRDNIPSQKKPYVNYILIGINALIFFIELQHLRYLTDIFKYFGIVPLRYSHSDLRDHFTVIEQIIPFISSMFLHGGWLHLIGNMWVLYIFGDNVEDYLGHWQYFIFYIACGIFAGIFHLITNWGSHLPTIGASGAIAGIMGAYFILYPHARVLILLPIFLFIEIFEVPAYFFLGFWFLIQFFSGTFSLGTGSHFGGVAWWAHIGGFLVGLYIINVIQKIRYRGYQRYR